MRNIITLVIIYSLVVSVWQTNSAMQIREEDYNLVQAILAKDAAAIKDAIDAGANINYRYANPLVYAINSNNYGLAYELYVYKNADKNSVTMTGQTPVQAAAGRPKFRKLFSQPPAHWQELDRQES